MAEDMRQKDFPSVDHQPPIPTSSQTSSGWIRSVVFLLILVSAIGAVVYGSSQFTDNVNENSGPAMLTAAVQRDELVVTVTEDGNIESASNVDIKCQVAGGSSILWIVEDGKEVAVGDKLVELDSSQLEEQINTQRIAYERASASKIQAEKDFSVAGIAVDEYLNGVFEQELQLADTQITIAEENLRSSRNALTHSNRMFLRGYVSKLELEGQEFAVKRAGLELASATTAKKVLEDFTKVKTLEDLRSKRDTAEAKMKAELAAFNLEEDKLQRLEDQLKNCVITAKQSGMVVFANETGNRFRGQQGVAIEEGAMVRERQSILRLPDLSQMQVKVNVHESKVEDLKADMPARVQILGKDSQGVVISVANQPEPTSWFTGNVKEYATIVSVKGDAKGLRPGMTAEVEILVDRRSNVLVVPIAAVVEQGNKFFCWVKNGETPERRPLVLGLNNGQMVEVKDGVKESEEVVLNPRAFIEEARGESQETVEEADIDEKFGPQKTSSSNPKTSASEPDSTPQKTGQSGEKQPDRAETGGGRPGGERSGGGRPGGGGFDPAQIFTRMDADGNGRLEDAEISDRMKDRMSSTDTDGDGAISKAEFMKAMQEAMKRMREGGGFGGGRQPGGQP